MRKNLLLFGAFVSVFLLASCVGNKSTAYSQEEVKAASSVIQYYGISLEVLKNVADGKDINAVLGYMEQGAKALQVPVVKAAFVSEKDTLELMNPGTYFSEDVRMSLKENYAALFRSRTQFYAAFDKYLSYVKEKKQAEANKLLDVSYQLSTEITEYKQNIFDILAPAVEQSEVVVLANNPLKEQLVAVRRMDASMRSIVNLYTRKHVMDGLRLDLKIAELSKELATAKNLPAVTGHEEEIKSFEAYLSEVGSFLGMVKKARGTGQFTDADYEMLTSIYGASMI